MNVTFRLKQSLALPKIQPRPPCPPKVYQKLYRFLDTALLAGTRRSTRALTVNKEKPAPKSSPSKPKTPVKATPFKQATPRTRASRPVAAANEVPEWVMAAIRLVCQKLGAPSAPHHVFAGVSSILMLPPENGLKTDGKSADASKNISALIIVIFLVVYARLAAVKTPPEIFLKQKTTGFAVLREYLGEEAAGEAKSNDADFDGLIVEIKDKGWTEMDWFENVTPGTGVGPTTTVDEEIEEDSITKDATLDESVLVFQDHDETEKDFLQAGLGTMVRDCLSKSVNRDANIYQMQDKVDYLSEKRRHHYQEWKKGILLRIEELKQAEEMNLGAG